MRWTVMLEATVESEERPDPDDFYLDFNNNLPYGVVDQSVEVKETRE